MLAKKLHVAREFAEEEDIRALLISLNILPNEYGEVRKLEVLTLEVRSGYLFFGLSDESVEMGLMQPEGSLRIGVPNFLIQNVPVLPDGVYTFHNLTVTFVNENITLVEFNNRESFWKYIRALTDMLD